MYRVTKTQMAQPVSRERGFFGFFLFAGEQGGPVQGRFFRHWKWPHIFNIQGLLIGLYTASEDGILNGFKKRCQYIDKSNFIPNRPSRKKVIWVR